MAGIVKGFLVICFILLLVVFIGFYNVIINIEENACNMTYMFEYPQYVRISLDKEVVSKYRGYSLYAYSEGRFTEKTRQMKFTGIPVLFIHGHRGSYKQVRSLSSVSLRKALKSRVGYHFDFFTVDLNEEYSGFYGGVLDKQTEFVRVCIDKILSLYPVRDKNYDKRSLGDRKMSDSRKGSSSDELERPPPPDSVVLFAHSMGGMIAKGLFLEDMLWSRVRLIVTLATPHTPVVLLDSSTASYYDRVNSLWDGSNIRDNITLVSIGGGTRDLIVHSGHIFTPHANIALVSSEVQGVWLETDHLSITWCKELMLVLVRALFDCVDPLAKRISLDNHHRLDVFKYHLLERSGSKDYSVAKQGTGATHTLWKSGSPDRDEVSWLRLRKNQLTWTRRDKLTVQTNILISLVNPPQPADTLLITTLNHNTEHWIFTCKPDISINNIKVCSKGEDISWRGRISPTYDMKRKIVLLDLISLRMQPQQHTHLVVITKPTDEPVEVSFDLFINSERGRQSDLTLLKSETLVERSRQGQLYQWFYLPPLHRPWQAYRLSVKPHTNCTNIGYSTTFATVSSYIPWHHQGTHLLLSEKRTTVPVTMYTERPRELTNRLDTSNYVKVSLYLESSCSYQIRLEGTIWLSLGRLIVRNYPSILVFVSVCLIMCLSSQIETLGESGDCPLIHAIACKATKPYYILPAANIIASTARALHGVIGKTDLDSQSGLVETLVLPLVMHCSSVALTLILSSLVLIAVVFHGQAFNSLLLKFLSKLCLGVPWISSWIMSGISKLPVIVSCIMLLLIYSACSSLAIYIGLIYYFIKLVMYYEDFWDEVVYWPLRVLRAAVMNRLSNKSRMKVEPLQLPPLTDMSFHLTLLLIWSVIAVITTPSLLSWAHSYRYSKWLEGDPFISSGVILSICGAFLWQAQTPRTHLVWSREASKLILSTCVVILVYCQINIYRLEMILTGVISIVVCHQLVASPSSEAGSETPVESDSSTLYMLSYSLLSKLDTLFGTNTLHNGNQQVISEHQGGQTEQKLLDQPEINDEENTTEKPHDKNKCGDEEGDNGLQDRDNGEENGELESDKELEEDDKVEVNHTSTDSSLENISASEIK